MDIKSLEKIGLTKNESIVYTTLLQLGTSKTGEILTKSGLNSGKIYEILEGLKAKGLVSESIINKIKHFTAAPPRQLIDYLEQKKQELDKEEKTINTILPNLEKLRKVAMAKTKSVTYIGYRGFKTAVEEAEADLKEGDEVLAMGVTGKKDMRFNNFWINQFKKRHKQKRMSKTIFAEMGFYYKSLIGSYAKCKVIPMYSPAAVTIFGKDKTLLLNYKEPYTFTLIYDKEITTSFINFFYQMWDQKAKTFHGIKGIKDLLYELMDAGGNEHHTIASSKESLMLGEKFWHEYHKKRAEKGIKAKLIFNESVREWCIKNPYPDTEYKFTSAGFEPLTETIIRNDKLAFIIWTKVPMGIVMENKEAANSYDKFFNMMWEQDVQTYKGDDAIKTCFNSIAEDLNQGDEWLVIGASKFSSRFNNFFIELAKKMKDKKLKTKLLFDEDMKEQIHAFKKMGQEVKVVSREYAAPAEINIYGNKVLTVVWTKEPRAWVVENKEIADSYKKFFKMLWGEETRTYKGIDAGISSFEKMINSMKQDDEWIGYVISPKISPKYFEKITKLHEMRAKKGFKSRIILSEDSRKQGKIRTNIPHTQVRYVEYDTPTIVNVAGGITLLNVPAEKETTVIYIENKKTADSFRQQFERIWKTAKK